MKRKIKVFLLIFIVLIGVNVFSQKTPPTPPPAGKTAGLAPHPGLELPIDGGIVYLVISGLFYGVYEIRKRRKN